MELAQAAQVREALLVERADLVPVQHELAELLQVADLRAARGVRSHSAGCKNLRRLSLLATRFWLCQVVRMRALQRSPILLSQPKTFFPRNPINAIPEYP